MYGVSLTSRKLTRALERQSWCRYYYAEDHLDGHTAQRFADRALIEVKGGKGGNGCISHEVLSPGRKRASGGSGGSGGNVFIVGDPNLFSLKFNTYHFNAGNGRHGGSQALTGRCGEDVYVRVPLGTIVSERFHEDDMKVTDSDWDDVVDETETENAFSDTEHENENADDGNGWELMDESAMQGKNIVDGLQMPDPVHIEDTKTVLLVARGGAAGIGNKSMMRSKGAAEGGQKQKLQSMPRTYIPGQHGEARSLLLELKIIADVGLVGFPNAGKSSLLRMLSNALPKVASYRFTTLHPSVGIVEYSDCGRISVADIPGLIEGAHENRGLGHDFLRHIERTKLLLYVVDASASERDRSPAADLESLVEELRLYDETLLEKPALVFANKYDLDVSAKHRSKLDKVAKSLGLEVLPGSALEGKGIPLLARRLREVLNHTKSVSARSVSEHDGDTPSPQRLVDAPASNVTGVRSTSGRASRAKIARSNVLGKSHEAAGNSNVRNSSASSSVASEDFEVVEIKSAGRSRRLPPVVRRRKPAEGADE